jgi:hypothetical protein
MTSTVEQLKRKFAEVFANDFFEFTVANQSAKSSVPRARVRVAKTIFADLGVALTRDEPLGCGVSACVFEARDVRSQALRAVKLGLVSIREVSVHQMLSTLLPDDGVCVAPEVFAVKRVGMTYNDGDGVWHPAMGCALVMELFDKTLWMATQHRNVLTADELNQLETLLRHQVDYGLLHGDLHLDNILVRLRANGTVERMVLSDFGHSRLLDENLLHSDYATKRTLYREDWKLLFVDVFAHADPSVGARMLALLDAPS